MIMKLLFSLLILVSFNAYAVDICSFEETSNFTDSMSLQNIKPVRTAKNHKKFTSVEKHLIHKMVNLEDYRTTRTIQESLEEFGDYYDGKMGSNAGEVVYYNFEGQQIILVHYWPGDNEVGAFFSINRNGSFKLLATVSDSFISCK
jgi:hypothetical protein